MTSSTFETRNARHLSLDEIAEELRKSLLAEGRDLDDEVDRLHMQLPKWRHRDRLCHGDQP